MYAPRLLVVCICLKDLAAGDIIAFIIVADSQIAGICICLEGARDYFIIGICGCNIQASTDIETQRLESVHLVIHRNSADETDRLRIAQIVIQLRKRARTHQNIRLECSSLAVAIVPVAVCGRIVDAAV